MLQCVPPGLKQTPIIQGETGNHEFLFFTLTNTQDARCSLEKRANVGGWEREVKILFLIESFHLKKSFLACLLPPKKARPTFPYLVRDLS